MVCLVYSDSIVDSESKGIQLFLHGVGVIFRIFQGWKVFSIDRVSNNKCKSFRATCNLYIISRQSLVKRMCIERRGRLSAKRKLAIVMWSADFFRRGSLRL